MCMLLHRYTVSVIRFANGIPFYNSGLIFDHIALSIYALQCYMLLSWMSPTKAGYCTCSGNYTRLSIRTHYVNITVSW